MHILELKILPHQYSIHKLLPKHELPVLLYRKNSFFSFTSTDDETSLICESSFHIKDSVRDDSWSCIKLVGQLNVEETGIWSRNHYGLLQLWLRSTNSYNFQHRLFSC